MGYRVVKEDFNQNFEQQNPQRMMMLLPPQLPVDNLALLMEKQEEEEEIERLLSEQSMNVGLAMHQLTKQQYTSLIRKLESRAVLVIRKKGEELAMMYKRILQLETCLKRKEEEKDAWEKVAREKAAMALSLNDALEQLQNPTCLSLVNGGDAEDQESSCSGSNCNGGSGSNRWRCCKICGVRDCCMLFLPCRHLCSCGLCDALVEECPVCKCLKQASVEIFLVA